MVLRPTFFRLTNKNIQFVYLSLTRNNLHKHINMYLKFTFHIYTSINLNNVWSTGRILSKSGMEYIQQK
jgi:hypothetical protein